MDFELTPSQERIVNEAIKWFYHGSSQIYEFTGCAGTGKSFTLFEIVRRLRLKMNEVLPCAYTGAASIIMRTKGFPTAKSIHSTFYHFVKRAKEYKENPFMNTQFNTPDYTYVFEPIPRGAISKAVKLIVIDEGYMVPDYMKRDIIKHGIRILVAGDARQLPPIGGEPAFLGGYNIPELTDIMRQEQGNPIIYLSQRAIHGQPIHCGVYGHNVLVIEEKDLTDNIILNAGPIICGTNKTRDYFNHKVRKLQGKDHDVPTFGDRVICRNNNWQMTQDGIALANGLAGFIVSPFDVNGFTREGTFKMDFLPDLLKEPFRNIDVNYNYIMSDYAARIEIKNDPYATGELFEFAYAITTHVSQGGQYPCGIVYEEFLRPSIQNALLYTAITRFKNYMVYVIRSKKYF